MSAGQIRAPTCIPLRSTPGSKQHIDDDTPIELSCDTHNTTIFYTINVEKPVPFDSKNKHTYMYTGPFLLPPGKRTIKSVAAYTDGRQSNIVTKVYYVAESNPVEDILDISLDSQLDKCHPVVRDDDGVQISMFQEEDVLKRRVLAESFRNNIQTLPAGGLYTANRARARSDVIPDSCPSSPEHSAPVPRSSTPNKGGSGTTNRKRRSLKIASDVIRQVRLDDETALATNMAFTKEVDKCPRCFTDKPPNPLAKYCHQCGFYLPPNNVDTTTVKCLHCHSLVPADLSKCVICHARITSQSLCLPTTEAIVCGGCKFKNPPGSRTCVVCEERLELSIAPQHPPPKPSSTVDENKRQCRKCCRQNAREARYCDWCGGSMVDLSSPLVCNSCTFQNPPLALYCGNCSYSLLPRPPSPTRVCWSDEIPTPPRGDKVINPREPLLISTDTQTEGIFYKSARRLQAEESKITDNMRQVYKSRGLSITKYSPGAGNWRQNIEHITNHIKVYSQLNSEYQEIVGKGQFGKVSMATLYKDIDELHVTYVFTTRKPGVKSASSPSRPSLKSRVKSPSNNSVQSASSSSPIHSSPLATKKRPSSIASTTSELSQLLADEMRTRLEAGESIGIAISKTNALLVEGSSDANSVQDADSIVTSDAGLRSDFTSNGDRDETELEKTNGLQKDSSLRKSVKKKAPVRDMHELRIGKLNTQLLREIGKDGDETRVARMIGQGADPNTKSSGGIPVVCLAAKNKHVGACKAIVEAGGDINATVPSTKDTALHVAVQQGAQDIVKFLISKGADFSRANTAGKTALDVARERHNQRAVQLFTASMGSNLLGLK